MIDYISQLKPVDPVWLDQIVEELSAPRIQLASLWREPYAEYGSAGMKVATLLNPTGEQENFDYKDCKTPVVTPLLEKLPGLLAFIKQSNLAVMGARLLRLDPGAFLHEHRDFVYLEPVPRFRLHLPLITNDRAFITSPGTNIHFKRGFLWKLDPKATIHSACNFGPHARIHLMLDCYLNEELSQLMRDQFLDESLKHKMPPLTSSVRATLLAEARELLRQSGNQPDLVTAAEEVLLKSFCLYDLRSDDTNLTSYDLLFELLRSTTFEDRLAYWQARLTEVYPDKRQSPELVPQ